MEEGARDPDQETVTTNAEREEAAGVHHKGDTKGAEADQTGGRGALVGGDTAKKAKELIDQTGDPKTERLLRQRTSTKKNILRKENLEIATNQSLPEMKRKMKGLLEKNARIREISLRRMTEEIPLRKKN